MGTLGERFGNFFLSEKNLRIKALGDQIAEKEKKLVTIRARQLVLESNVQEHTILGDRESGDNPSLSLQNTSFKETEKEIEELKSQRDKIIGTGK